MTERTHPSGSVRPGPPREPSAYLRSPPRQSSDDAGDVGYPRPQFRRKQWMPLNGVWEFALDSGARWRTSGEVEFDRKIEVPFAPETPRSGVGFDGFFLACWYRRTFEAPDL